jgi:tetratricopeptide (TPR) repeat protein
MCSASVFAQEQKSEEANSLTTNQTFERELQGNQTHKYRIVLQANECLEVKAEQKGIDVVIRLFDSEQKQLFEKDSPNGTQGFEELLFIANKAGNYEIYITALEKEAKSGNYTLKWNLRNPTGKDYEVVGSTYHELKQYDHALELYDKALNIWRQLSDKQNESRLLARIGYLYSLVLKQYEKAVQFNERGLAIARKRFSKRNRKNLF